MLGHSEATRGSPQSETDISVQLTGKTSHKDHEEPLGEQPSVTGTQRKALHTNYDIGNDTYRTSQKYLQVCYFVHAVAFQHTVCRLGQPGHGEVSAAVR